MYSRGHIKKFGTRVYLHRIFTNRKTGTIKIYTAILGVKNIYYSLHILCTSIYKRVGI